MSTKQKDSTFGIIFTHLFLTKKEKVFQRALMIPFLAIHAKGGESKRAQSKRTAPPPNFKIGSFQLSKFQNWYLIVFKRGRQ
jgi:hypothetical protein